MNYSEIIVGNRVLVQSGAEVKEHAKIKGINKENGKQSDSSPIQRRDNRDGTRIHTQRLRGMSEADYGVSYIASAPEELKVDDRVEIIGMTGIQENLNSRTGTIIELTCDGYCRVDLSTAIIGLPCKNIRKLPDTILFEERFGINPSTVASANKIVSHAERYSDNVKAFKAILNEMAETYKAKDADYGSAYDDGYRLFGHTQLLSRIYEKFSRVKHLLDGNKPNVAENICDTLTDMAVQAICLRMLLQKNDFENVN